MRTPTPEGYDWNELPEQTMPRPKRRLVLYHMESGRVYGHVVLNPDTTWDGRNGVKCVGEFITMEKAQSAVSASLQDELNEPMRTIEPRA